MPLDLRKTATVLAGMTTQRRLRQPIVWVDCEMTGLDPRKDTILEIAVALTDGDLKTVIEGPEIVIHHDEDVLQSMSEWCIENHGKSGLTDRVRQSTTTMKAAEEQVLEFVNRWVTKPSEAPLGGSSVHCDRQFLAAYMPTFERTLHYRNIDVSTIKEICKRWYPKWFSKCPKKKLAHRAMGDILESIEELRYYQQTIFIGARTKQSSTQTGGDDDLP
ncbi:unnamed protein product (mitochondrion) [Plasmodiophora brassicae]|uniref:Exonuclease domain-containing protein n=1 Tax=Plasmodiophora brassicae TaxID=37360 RepID=A0A0G4IRF6_PLABS|nr:hypothetical protein PBRA_005891 [Plasmodiophora brassicae]SPQ98323.1 unnamed protein product [Plasmodiophora brassicae]